MTQCDTENIPASGTKLQHIFECLGARKVTTMCKSNFWIAPCPKSMTSWNLPPSSSDPPALTCKEQITPNKWKRVSLRPYIAPQPAFSSTEHTLHGLPFNYWILSRLLPMTSSRTASWWVLFTPKWHLTPFHAIPLYSMAGRAEFRFTALQRPYSSQHKTGARASRCLWWCSALVRTKGKSMLQTALYQLALLPLAVTKLQLTLRQRTKGKNDTNGPLQRSFLFQQNITPTGVGDNNRWSHVWSLELDCPEEPGRNSMGACAAQASVSLALPLCNVPGVCKRRANKINIQ